MAFFASCSLDFKTREEIPSTINNDNYDNNDMGYKTCAICGRKVYSGEGMHYGGRLIHRTCRGIAKIQRYRLYG